MKFLSVAIASTISTFILGGTALPLPVETNIGIPEDPNFEGIGTPIFNPQRVPDPSPQNCGMHCPIIGKREPTPEPVASEPELETRQISSGVRGGAPEGFAGSPDGTPGHFSGPSRIFPRFGGGSGGFGGSPGGAPGRFTGPSRIFPRFGSGSGGFGGSPGGAPGRFSDPSRIFPRFGGGPGGFGGSPGGFGGAPGSFGGSHDGFGQGMMKRFISPFLCARDLLAGRCCGVCPSPFTTVLNNKLPIAED